MKRINRLIILCTCFALTASCADGTQDNPLDRKKHDLIDRDQQLSREDYRDLHKIETYTKPADAQVSANVLEPPIPDLAEILAAPKPPKIAHAQLVSVAVTDDVPLKDVLIELARLADVDIEVDAGITGGISFRAKDRPFNEVIERIANLAGLRYKVQNNVLRVERDQPYIQTYTLDMLNIKRDVTGSIGVSSTGGEDSGSTGGGSTGGGSTAGGAAGGGAGGSNSSITSSSESDFWDKFTDSVDKILKYQEKSLVSATTIAMQPAQPVPTDPNNPTPPPVPATQPSATGNSNVDGVFFSLNRQAGTLTVSATERQHDILKRFLAAIKGNAGSQVLIEAKIVEVTLNDRYQTGINWTNFGTSTLRFNGDLDPVIAADSTRGPATITLIKNNIIGGMDLSAAVRLLDEFGTTRALSSPRLNAINNQQAVLSFVENIIYFKVDIEVTDAIPVSATNPVATPAKIDVDSEKKVAPVGIVLTLQPSINKETNEITLSVRPTLSKVTRFVNDPGFEISKAQALAALAEAEASEEVIDTLRAATSPVPQLEIRELDSILKIKSGQVMVIGGLLEDRLTNNDAGVPGVSEVPYFGNLFKSVDKVNSKKELIILIRATVVDSNGFMDNADKNIYQKFMQDPRPIEFPPSQP